MGLNNKVNELRKLIIERNTHVQTAHTEKGHYYISPYTGELYKSVTFYTSVIKDPSLANYKMNRAIGFIADNIGNPKFKTLESLWESSKLAPETDFIGAGDVGIQTHAWREQLFKSWIESKHVVMAPTEIDSIPLPDASPEVISGCRAIKKFLKETGYIPIACEISMVDDDLKVGGMCDDLGIFPDGRLIFIDLKTSNQGKKPAYAYQVRGFYQRMIFTTFQLKPDKTFILHTNKDNGTYNLIDLTDMSFLEKSVENLVQMSRDYDKIIEIFKPKITII